VNAISLDNILLTDLQSLDSFDNVCTPGENGFAVQLFLLIHELHTKLLKNPNLFY